MNKETIVRTLIAIVVAINTCLAIFGINIFDGVVSDLVYRIISAVVMIASWAASHYKNNDFTAEGCEGTGFTRLLKASKGEINGENFFDDGGDVDA